jgi:hypothetical protein
MQMALGEANYVPYVLIVSGRLGIPERANYYITSVFEKGWTACASKLEMVS